MLMKEEASQAPVQRCLLASYFWLDSDLDVEALREERRRLFAICSCRFSLASCKREMHFTNRANPRGKKKEPWYMDTRPGFNQYLSFTNWNLCLTSFRRFEHDLLVTIKAKICFYISSDSENIPLESIPFQFSQLRKLIWINELYSNIFI